ncbi:MFS transporter [Paraburkholderia hayleyella]|uniref:MFS transporter n=1 Tax=Paraburkholderia hayleyella TaxID=2152889 RepID=UPI0015803683|nr:MFS transporter [Paraburkholderia hayleyella]
MAAMPHTLDVQQFIDELRFSPYQWFIFTLCFLIIVMDGFDTVAMGFVVPALSTQWDLSIVELIPVMSAALVGLAPGALVAGPLADRIGRKKVLLGAVLLFAAFSLACAFAGSLTELLVLRLLTGLGLGAAMPCMTALMYESAPARCRSLLVNTMFCGFTLGAAAGGLVAALLIPLYGWRSTFLLGGMIPLVLFVVSLALPESIRFMVLRGFPATKVALVLRRLAPDRSFGQTRFVLSGEAPMRRLSGLSVVLSRRFRGGTAMLWLTYFNGLLVYYLLTGWLPALMHEEGFAAHEGVLVAALFQLGGVPGAIGMGWLMDRFEPHRVIATGFGLTALLVWMVGQEVDYLPFLASVTFVAGMFMNGAQSSLPTLASRFYPTSGRATGVAWMLGMGRVGGIVGAFSGGLLLQAHFGFSAIFSWLSLPALVAAIALLVKHALTSRMHSRNAPAKPV